MTTKRMMGLVALVTIGIIGFVIFVIYATVKTKSTSLNRYAPFKEWVGQTVEIQREAVLFKEQFRSNDNNRYRYTLLDSLHPQWQYVQERKNMAQPDLEEVISFPAGTRLKLERAVQYTNGVSGSSYPTIFGTIIYNGENYKIGYQWGEINSSKRYNKIEKCWQFHQAPWQDHVDTAFYSLPFATFW